jgi:nucleotide-binding universal stress UspA family protein
MSLFARPLVGLSLTEPDEGVLRYAAMLARSFRWKDVHFLHVAPPDRSRAWDPGPWQDKLQAEVSRLFDDPALDCQLTFHAAEGSRLDNILKIATEQERDLVVLGHRRMRSGRRSLARRTAMVAPSSVWLVPEGSPPEIREILVPTDFSQHSADSLAVAVQIARAAKLSELRALHVFFDSSSVRFDEHLDEVLGKEEEQFRKHLASVDTAGVTVDPIYHESTRPSQAILRVAERCGSDLIVLNTRGRSQAAYVLLGSTTSETLAATTVPVLAVKHYGARMSLLEALRNHHLWDRGDPKTN